MAVTFNSNDQGQAQQPQGQPQQPQGQPQGQPQQPPQQPQAQSPLATLPNFARLVAKTGTSESLRDLRETTQEILSSYENTEAFKIVPADRIERGLTYSMLFITLPLPAEGGKTLVSYHTIILEGSRSALEPKTVPTMNGSPLMMPQLPTDAFADKAVQEQIRAVVLQSLPMSKNVELIESGVTVLPTGFDVNNKEGVTAVVSDAVQACATSIYRRRSDVVPFSVAVLSGKRVVTRPTFRGAHLKDSVGNPVRSDVTITVQVSNNGEQSQFTDETTTLIEVSGYIDLIYVDVQPTANMYQPQQTQRYYPKFVITNIGTKYDMSADQIMLLGLATVGTLASNKNWARAFHANESNILSDLGAIGYEAPFFTGDINKPAKINIKALSPKAQVDLINDAIVDELLVQIDVPEAGDMNRLTSIFSGLSSQDQVIRIDAINRFLQAAGQLTNGTFNQLYGAANQPQVTSSALPVTKVFLGHYRDRATGDLVDVRNIDHLAMLNLKGQHDATKVIEYDRTFTGGESPDVQATRRLQLVEGALGGAGIISVSGVAYRHTLNGQVVKMLNDALTQAGLHINLVTTGQGYGGPERPSFGTFAGQGLNSANFNGAYSYASNNVATNGNFGGGRYRAY